ncbi:hypothetical protein GCM10027613_42920 [Microlunatus endophyticus]
MPMVDHFSLQEQMRRCHVPGVAGAVITGDQVHEFAVGVRSAESPEPVTSTSRFQAASISKPLASLAMLRLVDAGVLDLDRDVNTYLRSWQLPASSLGSVTLRQLASHSAGLGVSGFPGYGRFDQAPSLIEILDGAAPANTGPVRVECVPGEQFRYSGGGTVIMQLVLEEVTGEPFHDLVARLVLEPFGMVHSSYRQPPDDEMRSEAAVGHDESGAAIKGDWHVYPEQAAAGLWTTAGDLARYVQWLNDAGRSSDDQQILKPETFDQMLTPQTPTDEEVKVGGLNAMGIGPFVRVTPHGVDYVGHSGGNAGFRCHLLAHRSDRAGAVVLTNGDGGYPLLVEIFDAIARCHRWTDYPYGAADRGR